MNTTKTVSIDIKNLPRPIADKLDYAAQRIHRIILLRGVFAVVAVALVSFLVVMAIDAAAMLFSDLVRWLLSLAAFAAVAGAVYWYLIRSLSRRLTPAEIARVIEIRNPNLKDERISSTVEILGLQAAEAEEFSQSLLNQLVSDAEKDAVAILPQKIFTWRSARRFTFALAVVGLVYAALFVAWPQPSARLLMRAVAPYARIGGLHADQLVVSPGDVRLAIGDPLTVRAQMRQPMSRRIELRTRSEGRRELVERMRPVDAEPGEDNLFIASFPQITENFDYRVRAGRALTEFYRVRAFPRPEITRLHLHHEYPEYTGRPPRQESARPGRIQALAGSTLTLSIETNTALAEAELLVDDRSMGRGRRATVNGQTVMQWIVPTSLPSRTVNWRIEKKSTDGFANQPVRSRDLVITADQAPEVTVTRPQNRRVNLPPDGFLPVQYRVTDDFGLTEIKLQLRPEGAASKTVSQALPPAQNGEWQGRALIDLSAMQLSQANVVRAEIIAYDNLPEEFGGPNRGSSETITIHIDRESDSLTRDQLEQQRHQAEQSLDDLVSELQQISRDTEAMRQLLAEDTAESRQAAMEAAAQIRQNLSRVDQDMRQLAEQLQDTVFQPIADRLRELVDQQMAEAQRLSQELPLADDQAERTQTARELQEQVDSALAETQKLQDQIDPLAEAAQELAAVSEMAWQQEQLAHQAQQEEWLQTQEDWMRRQEELAELIAAMTEQERARQDYAEQIQSATQQMEEASQAAWEAAEATRQRQELVETAAQAQAEAAQAQQTAEQAQADTPEAAAQADQEAAAAQQAAAEQQAQASGAPEAAQAAEQAQAEAAQAQQAAQTQQEPQPQMAAEAATQAAQAAQAAAQAAEAAQQAGMPETGQTLQDIAQAAQEAAQQMAAAAPQVGTPEATQAMDDSAAQMTQLAESMQQMAAAAPGAEQAAQAAMAEAAQQAAEAAAEAAAEGVEGQGEAAARAGEAAGQMQQMSQAMAQAMGLSEDPFGPGQMPMPSEPGEAGMEGAGLQFDSEEVPDWAVEVGLSLDDWIRLRGLTDPDGEAVEDTGIPSEYRELVRRYFQELGGRDSDNE